MSKWIANERMWLHGENTWCNEPISDSDIEYIQSPKWISVEDRLPKSGTLVLVTCDRSGVIKLWYWYRGKWMDYATELPEYITMDITHWQPLPDPPEVNDD